MVRSRPALRLLLTHGAALVLGWFACRAWLSPPASAPETLAAPKTGRHANQDSRTAEEVIELVLAKEEAGKADPKNWGNFKTECLRLVDTMEVPADIRAAMDAAALEWSAANPDGTNSSPQIVALFYHWLLRDAKAAQEWSGWDATTLQFKTHQHHGLMALIYCLEREGPEPVAGVLHAKSEFTALASFKIAEAMGKRHDPEEISRMKEGMPPGDWERLRGIMARAWPEENREDLLTASLEEGDPDMLTNFAMRAKSAEAQRWLLQLASDDSLPEEFRKHLGASDTLSENLLKNPDIPIEERLARQPGEDEAARLSALASRDVKTVLNEGRDWRHAFLHGEASAAEVLQVVAEALPEWSARSAAELRNQLYVELVEEDPARAMELLADLSPAERAAVAIQGPLRGFRNVDPNRFVQTLESIPSDTPELWNSRLEAWQRRAMEDQQRYSEDYVQWVRDLPPGLDREMGLFSLAKAVAEKQPALAEELRSGIQDPGLRKRLEDSP